MWRTRRAEKSAPRSSNIRDDDRRAFNGADRGCGGALARFEASLFDARETPVPPPRPYRAAPAAKTQRRSNGCFLPFDVVAALVYVLRFVLLFARAWRLWRICRLGYIDCRHCAEENAIDVFATCPRCMTVEYGNRLSCTGYGLPSPAFPFSRYSPEREKIRQRPRTDGKSGRRRASRSSRPAGARPVRVFASRAIPRRPPVATVCVNAASPLKYSRDNELRLVTWSGLGEQPSTNRLHAGQLPFTEYVAFFRW